MRARAILGTAVLAVVSVAGLGGVAGAQESGAKVEISHAAEECIVLLEKGGEPDDCNEAPSPILPATNELVWGILSFVVLFGLLAKLALPGIQKAMAARTQKIQGDLDAAEHVKTEADAVLADYQGKLADARNEAARVIEEARQTADQLRRDLLARAEAEVAELRQRTRDDISAAQERAMADLQARVADLAIELAEKVVGANLDRDRNVQLVEQFISDLARQRA